MITVRAWNSEAQKARLQSIGAGRQSGGSNLFKLEEWSTVYFYLMQPWNERGLLFREIFACYNLPPLPGKKWSNHTAWKTWEHEEPGISLHDPIMRVLEEYKDKLKDEVQRLRPNPKYHCNILVVGTQKLNKDGSPIADSYKEETNPQVHTLALTPVACREMMKYLDQANKTPAGTLTNPYAAGLFALSKVEKQQEGGRNQTAYVVKVMGTEVPPTGLVPNRYNLVEKYGEEKMSYLDSNLPDLDAAHPLPTEGQRVEAELLARVLKEKLSVASSKRMTAKDVGAVQTKDGTLVVAPPAQPANAPTPPAPPVSQAAPPPPPPPAATPLVQQAAPVQEAPPASSSAVTGKDILTKDLGLTDAPRDPATKKPLCFCHYTQVSTSPNGKWCESCTWRRACKLTEEKKSKEAAAAKETKVDEPQTPSQ